MEALAPTLCDRCKWYDISGLWGITVTEIVLYVIVTGVDSYINPIAPS